MDEFCVDCTAAVQVAQSRGNFGVSNKVTEAFNFCIKRSADYEAKSSKASRHAQNLLLILNCSLNLNSQEVHDVELLLRDVVQ